MPPPVSDMISILVCGSNVPTSRWLGEKARPLVMGREAVTTAVRWLRGHNTLYHDVLVDEGRISVARKRRVLDHHIEHIEQSSVARTLVSSYDGPDPHSCCLLWTLDHRFFSTFIRT